MKTAVLERISVASPLEAAVLRTGRFPLDKDVGESLVGVLQPWIQALAEKEILEQAMWLQGAELHRSDTVDLLVKHGAEWMPDIGLGVRPDGEPPRMLRADDFRKRRWDAPIKPKHETAFHLMNGAIAAKSAFRQLCGSGTVVYCLLDAPVEVYLAEQRTLWLPKITEPAFRAHPFYMPFLYTGSLEKEDIATLLLWMGRARLYLRESVEDEGVIVVSSVAGALDLLQDQYSG